MSDKRRFKSVYDDLEWRGAIHYATPDARAALNSPATCYTGIDASAPILHIGHLAPLVGMLRMRAYGHKVIALLGGGTSLIGDPSGKDAERPLALEDEIEANAAAVRRRMEAFFELNSDCGDIAIMNNADWLRDKKLIDFLRDVGKHITANSMVKRTAVKTRMERAEGISYTEFSYQLIQAYDFLHLYETEGCAFQTGGSDQWGNIAAGIELIKHRHPIGSPGRRAEPQSIVYPLVTTADGVKFGKSEANAPTVALNADITSPYAMYQFLLNAADSDVIKYLKLFTFLNPPEVDELASAAAKAPQERRAQKVLAEEVVGLVHGASSLERVKEMTRLLFAGDLRALAPADFKAVFENSPQGELPRAALRDGRLTPAQLASEQGLFKSIGDAKRAIAQGGLYLNERRATDAAQTLSENDIIHAAFIVLRRGKKGYHVVKII